MFPFNSYKFFQIILEHMCFDGESVCAMFHSYVISGVPAGCKQVLRQHVSSVIEFRVKGSSNFHRSINTILF